MKQKIGILTFHRSFSYGAHLQAFAMQKLLTKLRYDAEFIDLKIPSLYKPNNKKHSQDLYKKFQSFVSQNLKVTPIDYSKDNISDFYAVDYSAVIVGSDQVWNPEIVPDYMDEFLLRFVPDSVKKIAYAASFGLSNLSYSDTKKINFPSRINRFYAIGIREKSGQQICKKLLPGKETVHVLDPTLLIGKDEFKKIASTNYQSADSILTFFLEKSKMQTVLADEFKKVFGCDYKMIKNKVRMFDKKQNLILRPTINSWLAEFKNAKFILTDSYHGVLFSMIFKKQFAVTCFGKYNQFTRISDLLEMLNIKDRIINIQADLPSQVKRIAENKIDYHEVYPLITRFGKRSLDFLKQSLSK